MGTDGARADETFYREHQPRLGGTQSTDLEAGQRMQLVRGGHPQREHHRDGLGHHH
ncbi:hypothetical protein [Micromonospora tarensis]|uniref:Uncharacterized protein n=1 Tax=Micromonospora tarensis TaxID=2806100 RepID=A0ABS1YJ33_9ACTN|nr:hypothetical protein [Micromonospora tarensis]MBM0277413.1 hypothetical protein [Micromonospora tarensis]